MSTVDLLVMYALFFLMGTVFGAVWNDSGHINPWSALARAQRENNRRYWQCVTEYLIAGYSKHDALRFARTKLDQEAADAIKDTNEVLRLPTTRRA